MTNQPPQVENLKAMLALHEKRAKVQQELDAIDNQLATLQNNLGTAAPARPAAPRSAPPAAPAKGTTRRRRKTRRSRGQLKDKIFAALEAAGKDGVKVLPLADALGSAPANIYAWFNAAVKRYPQIKKLEGAHYRLEGPSPAATGAAAPAKEGGRAPARRARAPRKAGARKSGGKMRSGGMKEKIIDALSKAGQAGMTVKALCEKIGSNYKNVQVWFATTGKKVPGLTKIAPAHYRLS